MGRGSAPCRVCMKKSKHTVELQAIFVRKPRITYLESYNTCTQLNALIDDGLPKFLCTICKDELKAAFQFVEKAKESDRKLREKLGGHRITRSSHRIKQEEHSNNLQLPPQVDVETIFEEIKTEFINCSKDPLEDSDVDSDERSEDEIEMNWLSDGENLDNSMEIDNIADGKLADDDDDEDDKPLKELLIKKEKVRPAKIEEPLKQPAAVDSSDVFNDFPEPDNFSSDDDDVFNDEMTEHVPDPPTTAEAQIFPQGHFLCKICKKTYFTAAGLKAHIAVHMPKNTKAKRVRGPNKKKRKSKKKSGTGDEDDDEAGDENKDEEEVELKKDDNTVTSEGKDLPTKDEGDKPVETAETDGKKKRKGKTPKPKKMFPCHVCGKHMISASKLRYHMVMHTGEKDYLCTMCPKAYSTIYALKHHMRTHTGERPYECKFCGDKFTRPTTLKSHMRRHTGERPYGCDICGKRFIQHSSMTTHMKLNHMAKTIACPHCDKKYARQTDLNTHLLSHTGDKPFSCDLCPSRFIRQANLNKHMNQHHSLKAHAAAAAASAAAAATAAATDQMLRQQTVQIQQQQQQQQQQHNQIHTPLPRVVDVRSLAKQGPSLVPTGGVITAAPTSVGSDESNRKQQMLPPPPPPPQPPPTISQSTPQQQQHHQQQQQSQAHMQQPNMGQTHPANNVNSIPMSMNIAGIPGGIPTHNILGPLQTAGSLGSGSGGATHIATHGRLESVEHLKGIHHPVENLTNLLGQVIDPDRMGRSVDEIIRWNWPNGS